ncbi:MAG TPA: NADH-quinone oxidoreductase subunit M, partial [Methylomirabilota bacterium]|nr:NADH-quinone oxidoreductase subunit M [Methylomirabilota bacterium]
MNSLLLTILTFVPVIGGVALLLLRTDARITRKLAIAFSFVPLALVAYLWRSFDNNSGALQFVEQHTWVPSLGVDYFLGIDGLGLLMVTLSAAVIPFAIIATTRPEQSKLYFALLLF